MSPRTHTHSVYELQWSCEGYKLESTCLRRTAGWKDKVTFWFRSLKTIWAKQIIWNFTAASSRALKGNTQVSAEKWTDSMSDIWTLGSSKGRVDTAHTHTRSCVSFGLRKLNQYPHDSVFYISCFFALSLPPHKYSWHLKADSRDDSIDWWK